MPATPEIYYETVHFSGQVQGVGFRYTALQLAREYEVAGYVRNLPDGRVLAEVEGERAEVDRFIAAIGERMHGYVRQVERAGGRRMPQHRGFAIR